MGSRGGARADARAARRDQRSGACEEAEFVDLGHGRVFALTHLPERPPLGAVVICSPYLADFQANYQREATLARALTAAGFAVQRFHPLGEGNSDGDGFRSDFEEAVRDAERVTQRLLERRGDLRLMFLGTRLAGLLAAALSGRFDHTPVALWEPIDGRRYVREAFRARSVFEMKAGQERHGRAELQAQLAAGDDVDMLGYPLAPTFYDSWSELALADVMGSTPRPVLVARIGQFSSEGPLSEQCDRWRGVGFSVETVEYRSAETWWFSHDRLLRPDNLVEPTVAGATRHAAGGLS